MPEEERSKRYQVAGCVSSKTLDSIPLEIWSEIFGFAVIPRIIELESSSSREELKAVRNNISLVCRLFEVGGSQHSNTDTHPLLARSATLVLPYTHFQNPK